MLSIRVAGSVSEKGPAWRATVLPWSPSWRRKRFSNADRKAVLNSKGSTNKQRWFRFCVDIAWPLPQTRGPQHTCLGPCRHTTTHRQHKICKHSLSLSTMRKRGRCFVLFSVFTTLYLTSFLCSCFIYPLYACFTFFLSFKKEKVTQSFTVGCVWSLF